MKHATYEQIQKLYRETSDADLKIRYLAMLKFMEGYTSLKVAELLNTSDSTVREWLNRYNPLGLDGLIPQKPKGPLCRLTDEQLAQVYQVLLESPREHGFNKSNWTMSVLKIWINRKFGVNYAAGSLYDLVHRIGYSVVVNKKSAIKAEKFEQVKKYRKYIKNIGRKNGISFGRSMIPFLPHLFHGPLDNEPLMACHQASTGTTHSEQVRNPS